MSLLLLALTLAHLSSPPALVDPSPFAGVEIVRPADLGSKHHPQDFSCEAREGDDDDDSDETSPSKHRGQTPDRLTLPAQDPAGSPHDILQRAALVAHAPSPPVIYKFCTLLL